MKFKVDKECCIGCGFCASVCPEVFVIGEDDKAETVKDALGDNVAPAQDAAEGCPVAAISEE